MASRCECHQLQILKSSPWAKIPRLNTPGSVGYDLHSVEEKIIRSRNMATFNTGLRMKIPEGCYGRIAARSGLTVAHGLNVGAGVIDPDYRGEVKVVMFNMGERDYRIRVGDAIAQLILEKVSTPTVVEVQTLDKTERGFEGFGSTERKKRRDDF